MSDRLIAQGLIHRMMVSLSAHTLLIFEVQWLKLNIITREALGVISSLLCIAHCELRRGGDTLHIDI
ncbi:hypothetical protein [Vibrio rotiferianus]|uniref:hypothetical protein n=1 Tax=Vibrio rotiferianus TaxID=190895 RepID=UPI001486A9B1|nr:hypothetical protein [Vibrio rotiferianus]